MDPIAWADCRWCEPVPSHPLVNKPIIFLLATLYARRERAGRDVRWITIDGDQDNKSLRYVA